MASTFQLIVLFHTRALHAHAKLKHIGGKSCDDHLGRVEDLSDLLMLEKHVASCRTEESQCEILQVCKRNAPRNVAQHFAALLSLVLLVSRQRRKSVSRLKKNRMQVCVRGSIPELGKSSIQRYAFRWTTLVTQFVCATQHSGQNVSCFTRNAVGTVQRPRHPRSSWSCRPCLPQR